MSSLDVTLTPPADTISAVVFSPSSKNLLAASWDSNLYLYNLSDPSSAPKKYAHPAAVLDACFSNDDGTAYSGGLDQTVRSWDLMTGLASELGKHEDAVKAVVWSKETNTVISGSWDSHLNVYDPRSSTPLVGRHRLPSRVYAMDISGSKLVVAMAERNVHVYDVRKLDEPEQRRESALKYMTRDVACMADGKGWASCSIEGRIAVDYFSADDQSKKYAYRCHRSTIAGSDVVYPINTLAYHPFHNTFVSGGSDATCSIWDHQSKKRMKQYLKFGNAVSALAWSPDGENLAIATGYGWDEDALPEGEEAIRSKGEVGLMVRRAGDDAKPKPKA